MRIRPSSGEAASRSTPPSRIERCELSPDPSPSGEGWGAAGLKVDAEPIPLLASPLKGEESVLQARPRYSHQLATRATGLGARSAFSLSTASYGGANGGRST